MLSAIRRSSVHSRPYDSMAGRLTFVKQRSMLLPQIRPLSTDEYHNIADETLESITMSYENLVDKNSEIDVDLSQGVLTLSMPTGIYVINKQPPNHQIWLSSPTSGPKRFGWDEDKRKWVSPRGSITLGKLLKQETKDSVSLDLDLEVD